MCQTAEEAAEYNSPTFDEERILSYDYNNI